MKENNKITRIECTKVINKINGLTNIEMDNIKEFGQTLFKDISVLREHIDVQVSLLDDKVDTNIQKC